jgi:chaperonin cofactor prefoldin
MFFAECSEVGPPVCGRAAQRRFRERQKGLISALKEREETLSKQCEEQKRLIETLQKEIQVLKEIIHSKDPK